MKQVIAIHGGDAFPTYEEYIEYLKREEVDPYRGKGWKANLPAALGEEYEVLQPRMPNPMNAKYVEWKIWFEKFFPYLKENVILLGHSMGGIFLAKYLSENEFPKKVTATFLIAAPFEDDGGRPIVEFNLPASLEKFQEQGGKIFLYQSADDPVVNALEVEKYKKALPLAEVRMFSDRGHFNQEEFPEIVEAIKAL